MKRLNGHQTAARARARRESALSRNELRAPTSPRTTAVGPTSMAVKVKDPNDSFLIEAYLRKQKEGSA